MSDGDIFKVENLLYLQLGELPNNKEAPYAFLQKNISEQFMGCDPVLPRFYIPKKPNGLFPYENYYIDLDSKAIVLLDIKIFIDKIPIVTLSYSYMNEINKCALTRKAPSQKIKKYLRTNRK